MFAVTLLRLAGSWYSLQAVAMRATGLICQEWFPFFVWMVFQFAVGSGEGPLMICSRLAYEGAKENYCLMKHGPVPFLPWGDTLPHFVSTSNSATTFLRQVAVTAGNAVVVM